MANVPLEEFHNNCNECVSTMKWIKLLCNGEGTDKVLIVHKTIKNFLNVPQQHPSLKVKVMAQHDLCHLHTEGELKGSFNGLVDEFLKFISDE